jgi:hypothetical protein
MSASRLFTLKTLLLALELTTDSPDFWMVLCLLCCESNCSYSLDCLEMASSSCILLILDLRMGVTCVKSSDDEYIPPKGY